MNKLIHCRSRSSVRHTHLLRRLTVIATVVSFCLLSTVIVFADGGTTATATAAMYNFFKKIAIPVSAVGFAMCAFSFFLPNEKGFELAKKRMLHIGIAVMVLFLLPALFTFAKSSPMGQGAAWKPTGGNAQIIENAGSGFDMSAGPEAVGD